MTRDQLERHIEARLEACEQALSKWPDSVAWLARYHELGAILDLVQQLGPEVVQEPLNLDPETIRRAAQEVLDEPQERPGVGPLTFDQCLERAGYRQDAQDAPGSPVAAPGQDPAQAQGDQQNASQAASKAQQRAQNTTLALRNAIRKMLKEREHCYGDLARATGASEADVLKHVDWLLERGEIVETDPGWYRKKPQDAPKVDRSRHRPDYQEPPDGSTPRSWAIHLRRDILAYLKGSHMGVTATTICEALNTDGEYKGKLEPEHVSAQLENMAKRGVVHQDGKATRDGKGETGWEPMWKEGKKA